MILKLSLIRWCVTLIGVQFLCGIVWVLGPLLPALEPWSVRLLIVLALLLVWAASNLALDIRSARREATLQDGLTRAAQDEAAALGTKLRDALALLRKAKGRRGFLYELAWYVIIGPPGAGKTTALLNAGLKFPLAGELGPGAIAGVGGTRNCDWWFAEDAVLIDTAGRYTTQDSDRAVDRAGWQGFLALLRKTRPKQPLNGVIVAIPLLDAAADATGVMEAHAHAIRERLDELEERLRIRVPVYSLFTKADLLIGFTEFFDDLDRGGREQVWGATFPLYQPTDVGAALAPLLERLDRRVFQRLDAETNADRRVLIAGFPAQFANVATSLRAFVAKAFGPDAAGKAPLLRGVYFASGTQEGSPIDRLVGALGRSFGIDQRRASPLRPEAGKSYFLTDLLRDVVFREAMLGAERRGAARRRQLARVGGFAAAGIAALAGTAIVLTERADSSAEIAATEQTLAARQASASRLSLDPVADADFAALVPWLDAARPQAATAPPRDRIGFSQDAKLAAASTTYYRHALSFALLPRLVWRLEERMRGTLGQADDLYEATRVYLMLGGAGPLDRTLVESWFAHDWAVTYPDNAGTPVRTSLAHLLSALLDEPLPPVTLDGPLVAQARATFDHVSLATRAYSRLKPIAAAHSPAPWRPSDALGPAGAQIFLRLSGRGLDDGIPGLYTVDGFRDAVLPAVAQVARETAAESWVLGKRIGTTDAGAVQALEHDTLELYASEYVAAWDAMLTDLDPAPLHSLPQAAQDLYILASPHSPMRAFLAAAAKNLAPAADTKTSGPAAAMSAVDTHFQPLRALFGTGGADAIDRVVRPLQDLQQELAKQAASTSKPAAPAPGEDPATALRAEALRQPQPLARWLVAMATGGAALRDGGARGAMIAAWNAGGGPAAICPVVVGNRYPFVATATDDASLADVTRLLGPGGVIDAFFNSQLKPYVDTSARPWRLRQVDGVDAPLTPADLLQFQRAAALRDLLFAGNSAEPAVRLDVTPGPLDDGVASAALTVGSEHITATRGAPSRPVALSWPGQPPSVAAGLVATLPSRPAPLVVDAAGPWALFRLVARAHQTLSGDRLQLVFPVADRQVRFDIRGGRGAFNSAVFTEFRCPAVQ